MKPNKLSNNFIYLGLFLSFLFILLLGYWTVFPLKALELSNVKLNKTTVNRGEHIVVSADYCKYVNKPADLYITFIDGVIYNTQPQIINLESGCHSANLSIYIPKALPVGNFQLKGVFRYKVNPIRTIEVNHLSETFTILK